MSTDRVWIHTPIITVLGDDYGRVSLRTVSWLADNELPAIDDENGVHEFARALRIDETQAREYIAVLGNPGGLYACRN